MSAQIKKYPTNVDVQFVKEQTEKSIQMNKVMHSALYEIANMESGLDGGIVAKAIAADAVMTVHEIAGITEVQNA